MKNLRIGILAKLDREGAEAALHTLLSLIEARHSASEVIVAPDLAELASQRAGVIVAESLLGLARMSDTIFSLGGDGTMLASTRAIMRANPDAGLIGVNLGKLGFLSENPPEEIGELLRELEDGTLRVESRLLLHAEVSCEASANTGVVVRRDDLEPTRSGTRSERASMTALNEIVIDNFGSTRMLTFEIHVDGALLGVMRADGLIIATPTGSTGYAVSAGGPLVEPTSPVMIIAPIAPHSLNVRPIIVSENCTISVTATSEGTKQALVVADGQEELVVGTAAKVVVTAAPHRLRLLRRSERSYFDLLRTKFYWSLDSRDMHRRR